MISMILYLLWPPYRRRIAAELDAYQASVFDAVMMCERVRHRHWR